jgi:hypothetical protein
LWIREKESLYFAALKKDVGWLKKIQLEKIGMPVNGSKPRKLIKFHIKHSHGGILSEQGGSIDAFRLAHDILAYNHKKLQILIKPSKKLLTNKMASLF